MISDFQGHPGPKNTGGEKDQPSDQSEKNVGSGPSETEKETDPPGRARKQSEGHHPYPDVQKSEADADTD